MHSYHMFYSWGRETNGLDEGWYWQDVGKGHDNAMSHGPFESLEAVSQAHKQFLIDAGQELTPVA